MNDTPAPNSTVKPITCDDVARAVGYRTNLEPWQLGQDSKVNEIVQARDLYVTACDRAGLLPDYVEDWTPVRKAIASSHIDRAFRQMRTRGNKRDADKIAAGHSGAWFPTTLRTVLRDLEDLTESRRETAQGLFAQAFDAPPDDETEGT